MCMYRAFIKLMQIKSAAVNRVYSEISFITKFGTTALQTEDEIPSHKQTV